MALATEEEREALIRENPAFANVICRCELVTEGEILEAIHRLVGATTLDGVKRRTRAAWEDARRDSAPRRRWRYCRRTASRSGTDY